MSSPVSGFHWPPDPLSVLSPPSLRRQAWRHRSPLRKSAAFFPAAQPVRGVAAAHLDLRVELAPEWPGKGTFQPRIERVFLPPTLSESRLSILSLEKGFGFLGGNKRARTQSHILVHFLRASTAPLNKTLKNWWKSRHPYLELRWAPQYPQFSALMAWLKVAHVPSLPPPKPARFD